MLRRLIFSSFASLRSPLRGSTRFAMLAVSLCSAVILHSSFAAEPHLISGELIALDHINRAGTLRPDRTDAQRRGDWDLPLDFTLLPEGSISYHGAPAELRHIPIGTHLHGQFFEGSLKPVDPKAKPDPNARKVSGDSKYSRVLKLEDDFSHEVRLKRTWRVETLDLTLGTLTVTGNTAGKDDVKPTLFQIAPSTRVWKGRGIGTLADLKPQQRLRINLTVCTLKGPGRCVEIWLDDESRAAATAHQLEVHRQFMREHGLPGIIDDVDNSKGIVTVALFDGFDPKLMDEFPANGTVSAPVVPATATSPAIPDPAGITAAVAEDNLRTWDQINDRKTGPMIETLKTLPMPGHSGIRIRFQPSLLLEGFRPQRIIRIWPAKWKVDDLPREEKVYQ